MEIRLVPTLQQHKVLPCSQRDREKPACLNCRQMSKQMTGFFFMPLYFEAGVFVLAVTDTKTTVYSEHSVYSLSQTTARACGDRVSQHTRDPG